MNGLNCDEDGILPPTDSNSLVVAAAYNETGLGTGSVMLTPTLSRAERCPTLDDVEGLNMLYPTCVYTRQKDPLCVPSDMSGLSVTRMAAVVLTGTMISFFLILFFSWTSTWGMRKLDHLEDVSPYVPKPKAEKKDKKVEGEFASIDEMSQREDMLDEELVESAAPMHRI